MRGTVKELDDLGFDNLSFQRIGYTWDPAADNATLGANRQWVLTSKYLKLIGDKFANMSLTSWRPVENSLDRVAYLLHIMNLISTRRNRLRCHL